MRTSSPTPLNELARDKRPAEGVRLYVAQGTPNSGRAEKNLSLALSALQGEGLSLPVEVVDVFTEPKRAIRDGIIVTPTLIGFCAGGRQLLMGDLTDTGKLNLLLQAVLSADSSRS